MVNFTVLPAIPQSKLSATFSRWPSSKRGGIFKTVVDDDGGLLLLLKEESLSPASML
jgi:hypothetical protein